MAAANNFNVFLGVEVSGNARAQVAAYEQMLNRAYGNIADNAARAQARMQTQLSAQARVAAASPGTGGMVAARRDVLAAAREQAFEDQKSLTLLNQRIDALRRERGEEERNLAIMRERRAAAAAAVAEARRSAGFTTAIGMPRVGDTPDQVIAAQLAVASRSALGLNAAQAAAAGTARQLAGAETALAAATRSAALSAEAAQAAQTRLNLAIEQAIFRRQNLRRQMEIEARRTAQTTAGNFYGNAASAYSGARGAGTAAAATAAAAATMGLGRSFEQAAYKGTQFEASLHGIGRGIGVIQGPLGPLAGRVNALAQAFSNMTGVGLGAAAGGALAYTVLALGNNFQTLENRMRPLFETQSELNRTMSEVVDIANDSRASLDSVARLYQRLTVVGRELGLSQGQIAQQVETVTKATALSGATGAEAAASITQFAQAIGSNRLSGDELRSILENNLRLAQAIAAGVGVTVGELRKLGTEGALNARIVSDALASQANVINAEFDRMPVTIGQAATRVMNNLTDMAGQFNQTTGLVTGLANAINALADNLDTVAVALAAAGTAMAAWRIGAFITGIRESGRAAAALAVALTQMSVAMPGLAAANAAMTASLARGIGVATRLRLIMGGLFSLFTSAPVVIGLLAGGLLLLATRQNESARSTDVARGALDAYGRIVDQTTGKVRALAAAERQRAKEEATTAVARRGTRGGTITQGLANQIRALPTDPNERRRQRNLGIDDPEFSSLSRFAEDFASNDARRVASAIRGIAQEAREGNKEATRFLNQNRKSIEELQTVYEGAAAGAKTLFVLNGGTDPAVAQRQAEGRARAIADGDRALEQQREAAKNLNTLNDRQNLFNKAVEEGYAAYGVGKETVDTQRRFIDQLKKMEAPSGPGGRAARASSIEQAEGRLAESLRLREQVRAKVEETARFTVQQKFAEEDARNATRDHNKELRDQEKLQRQLARQADERARNTEAFTRFTEGLDGTVTQAERVEREIRAIQERARDSADQVRSMGGALGDLVVNDEAGNAVLVTRGRLLDIERQKRGSLLEPAREVLQNARDQLTYQALALQGRSAEADALRENARLVKEIGQGYGLTAQQMAELVALNSAGDAMQRQKARRDEFVRIYTEAAESIQRSFEKMFDNIFSGGIDSFKDLWKEIFGTFNQLRSRIAGAGFFRGMSEDIRRTITGDTTQPTEAQDQATIRAAIESLTAVQQQAVQQARAANDNAAQTATNTAQTATATAQTAAGASVAVRILQAALAGGGAGGIIGGIASSNGRSMTAADLGNVVGRKFGDRLDEWFKTTGGRKGDMQMPGVFGNIFGRAGDLLQGAGTGGMVAGIGKALGIRMSGTAAQIGGAIGNVIPIPGADIALSAIGGLLGGLFKKTPKSSATLAFAGGSYGVTGVTGSSRARRDQAEELGGGLADFLDQVAEALDGALNNVGGISIGTRKKTFRVDTSGQGRTKNMPSFDSEEEAIEFAVRNLLERGIISGISAAAQRILQSGQDLQKALEKAVLIESIPKRLKRLQNPVAAAIDDLNTEFTKLRDVLVEAGGSAQQFADLQTLYDLERAEAMKQANQQIANDYKQLLDEMFAGSSSPLSPRDRLKNAEATYRGFQAQINAGSMVDSAQYVEAARTYQEAARDVYGSLPGFFTIFDDIAATTRRAMEQVNSTVSTLPVPSSPFSDPAWMQPINDTLNRQVDATNQQTRDLSNAIYSLPEQIADALARRLGTGGGGGTLASLPANAPPTYGTQLYNTKGNAR